MSWSRASRHVVVGPVDVVRREDEDASEVPCGPGRRAERIRDAVLVAGELGEVLLEILLDPSSLPGLALDDERDVLRQLATTSSCFVFCTPSRVLSLKRESRAC